MIGVLISKQKIIYSKIIKSIKDYKVILCVLYRKFLDCEQEWIYFLLLIMFH